MTAVGKVIAIGIGLTSAYCAARYVVRKINYDKVRDEWQKSQSNKGYCKRMPISDEVFDKERLCSAREIMSHFDDIAHDYMRDCILALNDRKSAGNLTPDSVGLAFSSLRTKLKDIADSCIKSQEAELALLSDAYLEDLKSKTDYINSVREQCTEKYCRRSDYSRIIESYYVKLSEGEHLTKLETAEFNEMLDSLFNV